MPADNPDPDRPAHSARPFPRPARLAAGVGAVAALTAVGLGTAALLRAPGPPPRPFATLQPITVAAAPPVALPLTRPEILALLERPADLGPLQDPQRRAACLVALGYPAATKVLGGRSVEVAGQHRVLLVLSGDRAGSVVALAVAPNCNSADTGLLADTVVDRP